MHFQGLIVLLVGIVGVLWASKDSSRMSIAMLSTYPPTNCGIAEFAKNMLLSIQGAGKDDNLSLEVFSISKLPHSGPAPPFNGITVHQYDLDRENEIKILMDMAHVINKKRFNTILVQHEYGLLFNHDNYNIFLKSLSPKITKLVFIHTGISFAKSDRRHAIQNLAVNADYLVALGWRVKHAMIHFYGIPEHKILYIPHGLFAPKNLNKKADSKKVTLLMTGLMRDSKGLEEVLAALKILKERNKLHNIHLEIAGKDYKEGAYKQAILDMAKEYGIAKHVTWDYGFHSLKKLARLHTKADIYLTPFPVDVPTSGTISFAMGYGLPVISTPYGLAEELLGLSDKPLKLVTSTVNPASNSSGFVKYTKYGAIVPYKSALSIANAISHLAKNQNIRKRMGESAAKRVTPLCWENVGRAIVEFVKTGRSTNIFLHNPFERHMSRTPGQCTADKITTIRGQELTDIPDGGYCLYMDSYLTINAHIKRNKVVELGVRAISYIPIQKEIVPQESFLYANIKTLPPVPTHTNITKTIGKYIQYISLNNEESNTPDQTQDLDESAVIIPYKNHAIVNTPNLVFSVEASNKEICLYFYRMSRFAAARGLLGSDAHTRYAEFHQDPSPAPKTWRLRNWSMNIFNATHNPIKKSWMRGQLYGLPATTKRNLADEMPESVVTFETTNDKILQDSKFGALTRQKLIDYWSNPRIHISIKDFNSTEPLTQGKTTLENYIITCLANEGSTPSK
ncbi:hypothetical protein NEHOM01_1050 [Nematocida homosporus]|uniref:uncharacterized protein n=1 Tax=Nematocida homosporus TaxID=1912981 RepID=UPI00221E9284|nr:uncharacterized protein NEHOM01_1050 [Nematocida homosporus]KAI5185773.1 hypothetical protein NEHOM01_1050 [Nematocida homosporus]